MAQYRTVTLSITALMILPGACGVNNPEFLSPFQTADKTTDEISTTNESDNTTEATEPTKAIPVDVCKGDAMLQTLAEPCPKATILTQRGELGPVGLAECPDNSIHSYGIACCSHQYELGSCQTDDDCPAGEACFCAIDWPATGGQIDQWAPSCAKVQCRTDADCGNERCGVSIVACAKIRNLACRGPDDECLSNADCNFEENLSCLYVEEIGHFTCIEDIPPVGCGD